MTRFRLVVYAAAVLLLGGCGGAASDRAGDASGAPPPAYTASIAIGQDGTAQPRTIWYVRIETMKAEPLVEQAFPGRKIALTRDLSPGRYRVISWWRKCRAACPTAGEAGLGPLENVCGTPVTVTRGRQAKATVALNSDGCTVTVQ